MSKADKGVVDTSFGQDYLSEIKHFGHVVAMLWWLSDIKSISLCLF
jgi:hypothetical protein